MQGIYIQLLKRGRETDTATDDPLSLYTPCFGKKSGKQFSDLLNGIISLLLKTSIN